MKVAVQATEGKHADVILGGRSEIDLVFITSAGPEFSSAIDLLLQLIVEESFESESKDVA